MLSILSMACSVISARINDNDGSRMEFVSYNGGVAGEHNGVGLVEISGLFATQDEFFQWGDAV